MKLHIATLLGLLVACGASSLAEPEPPCEPATAVVGCDSSGTCSRYFLPELTPEAAEAADRSCEARGLPIGHPDHVACVWGVLACPW